MQALFSKKYLTSIIITSIIFAKEYGMLLNDSIKKQNKGKTQKIIKLTCSQCGYVWVPRKDPESIKICPNRKCHSPYWDEEKRKQV